MAVRRMLSKKIIDTDVFMDMPLSSQALYMHFVLNADDDGFIGNPRKIMRSVGCSADDSNILLAKRFILDFDSGVIVIKHWKIHNLIRGDRYTATTYLNERDMLVENENKSYTELNKGVIVDVIPHGNQTAPQVSIGKVSLVKVSLDYNTVVETWNNLGFRNIRTLTNKRKEHINARVNEVTYEKFLETLLSLKDIQFFKDSKSDNWFDFDWVVNPNNFTKILEGKYNKTKSYNNSKVATITPMSEYE